MVTTEPTSVSNHPQGGITLKVMQLLALMPGATATCSGPEVAPGGIVITIDVSLQELTVTGAPLSVTRLAPSEAPKPDPIIVTWSPMVPVVADTLLISGLTEEAEVTDTLSKVAVPRTVMLP